MPAAFAPIHAFLFVLGKANGNGVAKKKTLAISFSASIWNNLHNHKLIISRCFQLLFCSRPGNAEISCAGGGKTNHRLSDIPFPPESTIQWLYKELLVALYDNHEFRFLENLESYFIKGDVPWIKTWFFLSELGDLSQTNFLEHFCLLVQVSQNVSAIMSGSFFPDIIYAGQCSASVAFLLLCYPVRLLIKTGYV